MNTRKLTSNDLGEPYEVTPKEVIIEKLKLLNLQEGETLIDLGCGDGRNLIMAHKLYKVHCIGYELLPKALQEANENIINEGIAEHIEIKEQSFLEADLSNADALILYLTRNSLGQLSLKLENELPTGTRIVTHDFDIPSWKAEKVIQFKSKKAIPFTFYLYTKK